MRPIKGEDVLVSIRVDDEFIPVICATDMSLRVSQEVILATTIDTGIWRKKRLRQLSEWSVSVSGLSKIDNTDGQASIFYLLQENVRGTEQTIQIMFEDEDGNTQLLTGVVLIPEINLNASMSGFMDTSVSFEGAGEMEIGSVISSGDESGECDVLFSDTWILAEGETSITGLGLDGLSFAGREILEVNREGTQHDYTNGTPGNREFGYDGTDITFDIEAQPGGETVHVVWK